MEERILQKYVYAKKLQQNLTFSRTCPRFLIEMWAVGDLQIQWGNPHRRLSTLSPFMQGTYKVSQLNSHNKALQITTGRLLGSLVNDVPKTLIVKSSQATVSLIKL